MEDPKISAPPTSGALTTTDALSPRLRSLLSADLRNEDRAVEEIGNTPVLAEGARSALANLKRLAIEPAGADGVMRVIGLSLPLYPQPGRSEPEWTAWWAAYVDTCGSQSVPALEAAMKVWIAMPDSEFLPKPGKLRELAMTVRNPVTAAYYIALKGAQRADQLARMAEKPQLARHETLAMPQIAVRAMPTEHDRAAVRGMAANFAAQVQASKPPPPPPLPPTPVTFAPGLHISQAMLETIQRQDPDFEARFDDDAADEPDPGMFS